MKSLNQNRINADVGGYPMHEILCAVQRNLGGLKLSWLSLFVVNTPENLSSRNLRNFQTPQPYNSFLFEIYFQFIFAKEPKCFSIIQILFALARSALRI